MTARDSQETVVGRKLAGTRKTAHAKVWQGSI